MILLQEENVWMEFHILKFIAWHKSIKSEECGEYHNILGNTESSADIP